VSVPYERTRFAVGMRPDETLRRSVAAAEKALRAEFGEEDRVQCEADVRAVLATPCGRRFMMMVFGRARVFGSIFGECREHDDLVYQTGRREFGCEIYALVNRASPGQMRLAFEERDRLVAERNRRIADSVKRIEIESGVPARDAEVDANAGEALITQGDQT